MNCLPANRNEAIYGSISSIDPLWPSLIWLFFFVVFYFNQSLPPMQRVLDHFALSWYAVMFGCVDIKQYMLWQCSFCNILWNVLPVLRSSTAGVKGLWEETQDKCCLKGGGRGGGWEAPSLGFLLWLLSYYTNPTSQSSVLSALIHTLLRLCNYPMWGVHQACLSLNQTTVFLSTVE